jgi:hypothetical protein
LNSDGTSKAQPAPPLKPWSALEEIPGLVAVQADWRKHTGDHLQALWSLCLQATDWLAESFPCPRQCGCAHEVIMRHDRTSAVAACKCEPPTCPDIPVTIRDITPLELSWTRLGRALCKVFGLAPRFTQLTPPTTVQFGALPPDQVPAILTIQVYPAFLRSAIAELVAVLHKPFILFAPTGNMLDVHCQAMLESCGAAFFPLATTVTLTPDGILLPARAPGEIFARFRPDPHNSVAEDVAIQTFALAKTLDSEQRFRKAPVFTVFLLYCSDGLSADHIAKKCGCARSVVFDRLKLLREKLGRDPADLRQYSSHFEAIGDSLSDSRASRIHRPSAIDDPQSSE